MPDTPPRPDRSSSRPTLPPIRDLFYDELAGPMNQTHESPAATLARLQVTEEEDYIPSRRIGPSGPPRVNNPPHIGHSSQFRNQYQQNVYMDDRHTPSHIAQPVITHHQRHISSSVPYQQTIPGGPRSDLHPHRSTMPSSSPPMSEGPGRSAQLRHMDPHGQPQRHQQHTPDASYPYVSRSPIMSRHRSDMSHSVSDMSLRPRSISTNVQSHGAAEESERTPVARFMPPLTHLTHPSAHIVAAYPDDLDAASISSKYDCEYCGKSFNRPSSLKIHLNSHTGDKPFACPVESCGRSFSVLSNMRRHARVHNVPPLPRGNEMPVAYVSSSMPSSSTMASSSSADRWQHRRDSVTSGSSSSTGTSRRSHSYSSDEDDEAEEPTPKTNSERRGV